MAGLPLNARAANYVQVKVRVESTGTPPSLTSIGHAPASGGFLTVAEIVVALVNVVVCSTLLAQIRQPGVKPVPVQVITCVPVPFTAVVGEMLASVGLTAGDIELACCWFGTVV